MAMELGYTSLALRSMFGTNNGIAGRCSSASAPTSRRRRGSSGWPPAKWPRSR
jgi:hypothetical protein